MSGQGVVNQFVASPMTRITSQLECPVCYNIPRELPIPSCKSGHIVCRPCKKMVRDCPTCRQPMPADMTNSVVGSLIEQVQHKCKYSDQGCEVKMMLNDLQVHERKCKERTIKCTINNCGSIVKLRDFNEHAFNTRHSFRRTTSDMYFHLKNNDIVCNHPWTMFCVQEHNVLFHVCFAFYHPQQCFALSVWSATGGVAKYRANLKILGDEEKEMSIRGLLITSEENVPSIDKCMEKNGKYFWCIPSTLAFEFSEYKSNKKFMLHVDLSVTKKL